MRLALEEQRLATKKQQQRKEWLPIANEQSARGVERRACVLFVKLLNVLEHRSVRLAENDGLAARGGGHSAHDGAGAGDLDAVPVDHSAHRERGVRIGRDERALGIGMQAYGRAQHPRVRELLVIAHQNAADRRAARGVLREELG